MVRVSRRSAVGFAFLLLLLLLLIFVCAGLGADGDEVVFVEEFGREGDAGPGDYGLGRGGDGLKGF